MHDNSTTTNADQPSPCGTVLVLLVVLLGTEASATIASSAWLNDKTMLNGDRELDVTVTDTVDRHSLVFECSFDKDPERGEVSAHILFGQPLGDKVELRTGESMMKLKFDDGSIIDMPSHVGESGKGPYKIDLLVSSEEAQKFLDESISSKELTYGLFGVAGDLAQRTLELRGLFEKSRILMELFDMRCKHTARPVARQSSLADSSRFRLRDEVEPDGRRSLGASYGDTFEDTYEFRCLSGGRDDPVVMLVHIANRKPRPGQGRVELEFDNGVALDVEAEISHGDFHANVVLMGAGSLLDAAITSGEFTVQIQGRQWKFHAGDPRLEILRNRCILE